MMKKTPVRLLMLSGLTLFVLGAAVPTMAQSSSSQKEVEDVQKALESANASAGYTGNASSTSAQQANQAGQALTPSSLQTGMPVTGTQEEKPVTMRYNKKDVIGFYGVELPKRLFNNVPSDWSTPSCCKK